MTLTRTKSSPNGQMASEEDTGIKREKYIVVTARSGAERSKTRLGPVHSGTITWFSEAKQNQVHRR